MRTAPRPRSIRECTAAESPSAAMECQLLSAPGLTYCWAGVFQIKGGANGTGSGVMFYNTYNATYSYSPIVVSASSSTLSAQTSGTYEGILFFQDRNIPTNDKGPSGSPQNTVSGTSTTSFTGALYFPSTPLVFIGGSSDTDCTEFIADTLTISGTSYINNDCALFGSFGPPVKTPVVAE